MRPPGGDRPRPQDRAGHAARPDRQTLEPDVVEIYGEGAAACASEHAALAQRVETSGDTVFFYLRDAHRLLDAIAAVLPLSAAVELVRPLVIGVWPTQFLQPLAVLIAYAAIGYWIALALKRRRFFR